MTNYFHHVTRHVLQLNNRGYEMNSKMNIYKLQTYFSFEYLRIG